MSRRKSREQAFALLFEKSFNDLSVMDLAEAAQDARDFIIEPFALELAQGAEEIAQTAVDTLAPVEGATEAAESLSIGFWELFNKQ